MVSQADSLQAAKDLQQRLTAEAARDRAELDRVAPEGKLNPITVRDLFGREMTPTRMLAAGWVLKQRTDGAHWERT